MTTVTVTGTVVNDQTGEAGSYTVSNLVLTPAGATPTTWNPSDKGASILLTNNNLTVSSSSSGYTFEIVRTVRGQTAGKHYHEIKLDSIGVDDVVGIGVAKGTATLTDYLGHTADSVGEYVWGGAILKGGTNVGTGPTSNTNNQVFGIATDLDAKTIKFRNVSAAGSWSADIDITSIVSGTMYPAVCVCINNRQVTGNFGATAYAGTPPSSGFTNW